MKTKFLNPSLYLIFLFFLALLAGCSRSGLSRGQAADMIAADARYKALAETVIDAGSLQNSVAKVWQNSKEDTAEQAAIRVREQFKKQQPQLFVAEDLGFIKLYFENPELGGREMSMPNDLYTQRLGTWYFKARAEVTDAGRQLWKEAGFPENPRTLPLAARNAPEITGMVDDSEITKRVEFSYDWKPTELGAALDPANPAFAKLPQDLQNILKNPKADIFINNNKLNNFSAKRQGVANFRKYDDGWRLENLYLQ